MAIGISIIMLNTDVPVRGIDVQRHLAENWPDLSAASEIEETDDTLSFQIGESGVVMAKMPVPIPWSELEGPCETSILWHNATEEVKKHAIHWIVTVSGELEPLGLSTLLTQVTAATLASCRSAIGVYWGNATLIVPKGIFIDFAKDVLPHGPPLYIWVDVRIRKDSEKSSAGFTTGMKALGHMEFETLTAPESPGKLRERFLALAGYVIENGPVIGDGNTVGDDAEERIRVKYANSSYGQKDKVMRLVYENASAKKPWWKLW